MAQNKNKKFGLDIDGTVTDPGTFIPYLNKHFNRMISLDDIKDYDLTKLLGITKEQFWKWMQEHEHKIYEEAAIAYAVENAIKEWEREHHMIYISARGKHLYDVTKNWFQQYHLPYHHIELIGSHDKIETVKKHNIDIFFEDKHDNACQIAEECRIPVILLDTPYNRLPSPNNVIRVSNWLEAKEWVNNWLSKST